MKLNTRADIVTASCLLAGIFEASLKNFNATGLNVHKEPTLRFNAKYYLDQLQEALKKDTDIERLQQIARKARINTWTYCQAAGEYIGAQGNGGRYDSGVEEYALAT